MNKNDEGLVLFTWTNFILSGIQHGIQHGHSVDEMTINYLEGTDTVTPQARMYWQWIKNHKTVNVRNGGDQTRLREIVASFATVDNPYPWAFFREDESQNYLLTAVSIVVPERVYAWEPEGETVVENPLDLFDQMLYDLIKSTRHAS